MSAHDLTLGQTLALLKGEFDGEQIEIDQLSSSNKHELQTLRDRMNVLMRSPKDAGRILQTITDTCCHSEKPQLAENADFFIAHVIVYPKASIMSNHCERLSKHLNDCFRCFEEYSKVMRDYYHQSQK